MLCKNFACFALPAALACGAIAANATTNTSARTETTKRGAPVTAMDQASGNANHVETTRRVRQRLMDDDRLSTQAKNVNVVTLESGVTLSGTVVSEAERSIVKSHVASIAGGKVDIRESELRLDSQQPPAAR